MVRHSSGSSRAERSNPPPPPRPQSLPAPRHVAPSVTSQWSGARLEKARVRASDSGVARTTLVARAYGRRPKRSLRARGLQCPHLSPRTRRKFWTRLALIGGGGTFLAIVGVVAFIAVAQGVAPGASGVKPLACSPQPCLDLQDYTMWVSNVTVADGIVRMNVTFRNSSTATHASPEDLQLVDASKQSSPRSRTWRAAPTGHAPSSATGRSWNR